MIGILISLVIIGLAALIAYMVAGGYDAAPLVIATVAITLIIMLLFTPLFLIPITGGLGQNGGGEAQGYVTQVYHKGMIWVTCNFDMLAGDKGSVTTLCGSIVDENVKKKAIALVGKKVIVKYKTWIIAPFWVGREAEITDIEEVVDKVEEVK